MKHYLIVTLSILTLLTLTSCRDSNKPISGDDYFVCAYVWPSCHDDSLGRALLWPDGEGEWEVIKKGNPRFPGHYQPKQPLWGYEHDDDPIVVAKWIDTALKYGVNTFIYDWYWYNDFPYLEDALNKGFLEAKNNRNMNFYLMWANHQVRKNYWNYHKYGDDTSLLFDPKVNDFQFRDIVHHLINDYFKRDNYVKINGCPVFGIFDINEFIRSFGSLESAGIAMDYFRREVFLAGFKGLHIQQNNGGGGFLTQADIKAQQERIDVVGIDSHAFYNMGGFNQDYMTYGANAIKIREQWSNSFSIPIFPTVSIGWDDTPRFPGKTEADITRYNQTPRAFQSFLEVAKKYADDHPKQAPMIMINAWNEWVEGSYLLPDRYFGYGYLEAVRNVFKPNKDK